MMKRVTAVVVALALLGACAAQPVPTPPETPAPATGTSTAAPVTTSTTDVAAGMPESEPTEVRIPRIGARSSLVPLGLNPDETVEVPPVEQPMQAGWYKFARTPGEAGPAIILGHVDGNNQAGIFFRLKELVTGDEVEVSRKDGTTARFRVTRTEQVDKDSFPTDAVYGDTAEPELRLITCGGGFDATARSYQDNIIVYALLV